MPHVPDITTHAAHDPELIAAYAAGDATGPELDTALALVAGCAECAALHHDLRLIAATLPGLPAPVRRRDFRLSAEQAAALRPRGWRALAATFAGPGFGFAAPLGTALATLGLVGLLVSGPGLPFLASGGTTAGTAGSAAGTSADNVMSQVQTEAATAAPSMAGPLAPVVGPPGKADLASPAPAASQDVDTAAGGEPSPAAVPGATAVPERNLGAQPVPAPTSASGETTTLAGSGTGGPSPWPIVFALVVVGGAGLLAIRLIARRLAR